MNTHSIFLNTPSFFPILFLRIQRFANDQNQNERLKEYMCVYTCMTILILLVLIALFNNIVLVIIIMMIMMMLFCSLLKPNYIHLNMKEELFTKLRKGIEMENIMLYI